jgi:hypothetical protein
MEQPVDGVPNPVYHPGHAVDKVPHQPEQGVQDYARHDDSKDYCPHAEDSTLVFVVCQPAVGETSAQPVAQQVNDQQEHERSKNGDGDEVHKKTPRRLLPTL